MAALRSRGREIAAWPMCRGLLFVRPVFARVVSQRETSRVNQRTWKCNRHTHIDAHAQRETEKPVSLNHIVYEFLSLSRVTLFVRLSLSREESMSMPRVPRVLRKTCNKRLINLVIKYSIYLLCLT